MRVNTISSGIFHRQHLFVHFYIERKYTTQTELLLLMHRQQVCMRAYLFFPDNVNTGEELLHEVESCYYTATLLDYKFSSIVIQAA